MSQTNVKELVENLIQFSEESTQWCVEESAHATSNVLAIIDGLMKDSQRIAHLSEETLHAVKAFREKLRTQFQEPAPDFVEGDLNMTQTLIKELQYFVSEYEEIGSLVSPMIQALQFQDRISQEVQHKVAMLNHWWQVRQSLEGDVLSDEAKAQFLDDLRSMVTTEEERSILVRNGATEYGKDDEDISLF